MRSTRADFRRRLIAASFLAGSLAIPLAAAEKVAPRPVTESATVTAIEIPVNVTGADGKPFAGLTAASFELYDEGKKQEIAAVDLVDLRTPGAAIPAPARRHWLLVFDLSYSSPRGLARAREGARDFVQHATAETDLVGIATVSAESGVSLLLNFTRDRAQLAAAVNAVGSSAAGASRTDPLAFAFIPPGAEERVIRPLSGAEAASRETAQDIQRVSQRGSDDRERAKVGSLVGSLGTVARSLDSVRGRKHVLFFSEGFESRLLGGSERPRPAAGADMSSGPSDDSANEQVLSGQTWKVDNDSRFGSSTTRGHLTDALAVFRRSDTVLHAIDVSGLKSEAVDVSNRKAGSGRDALFTLAHETEGELVADANRLSADLAKVSDRSSLVYVLVYQPKGLTKPGAFHTLRVKVNAPGARVSTRSGYYEPRPYTALSPLERLLATGDLVTSGGRNSLSVSLLAAAFPGDGGLASVPLVLEIPGSAILAGEKGAQESVQLYAYATNGAGTLVDYRTQEVSLDLAKARASLEGGGIKYYGTLSLPPGEYTLRAVVRTVASGLSGSASATLHVPAMPGGPAMVLPPLFQDSAARWVMVKAPAREGREPGEYPFTVGGDAFVPWAAPSVEKGSETRVTVVTCNFPQGPAGGKPPALELHPELSGNGRAWPASLRLLGQTPVEKGGTRKILLTFKPENLPPGTYRLKVGVSEPGSGAAAEGVTEFEVRAAKVEAAPR